MKPQVNPRQFVDKAVGNPVDNPVDTFVDNFFAGNRGLRQLRNVSPVSDTPFDKALGIELIVGSHHAVARNRQCCRQIATGR